MTRWHILSSMYKGLCKTLLVVVALLAVIAAALHASGTLSPTFGAIDLLQYWAGAKLFLSGSNPYDPQLMLQLEQPFAIPGVTLPVLLWNPPLVFPFILFLAALPFPAAAYLWGLLSAMLLAASVVLLGAAFDLRQKRERLMLVGLLVIFYPFALSMFYGQITPILLLGLSGFFYFLRREGTATGSAKAGVALSLTVLKPHLLYLVYLYLLVLSGRERRWRTLAGLAGGALFLLVLSMAWNQDVLAYYVRSLSHPPIEWKTPTLGSHLQALFPGHAPIARLFPTGVCAALMLAFLMFRGVAWENLLIMLLPISLLTSPYGWVYDQMLLLPVAAACIARLNRGGAFAKAGTAMLFLANLLVPFSPEGQQWMVWYPLLFLFPACVGIREKRVYMTP